MQLNHTLNSRNRETIMKYFLEKTLTNCSKFFLNINHRGEAEQRIACDKKYHDIRAQKTTRLLVSGQSPECSDCLLRFIEQQ